MLHCSYVSILYSFWDIQRRIMVCSWNLGMSHSRSLKKQPIDRTYMTSYGFATVSTALHCAVFEISAIKKYFRSHSPREFMHDLHIDESTDSGLSIGKNRHNWLTNPHYIFHEVDAVVVTHTAVHRTEVATWSHFCLTLYFLHPPVCLFQSYQWLHVHCRYQLSTTARYDML